METVEQISVRADDHHDYDFDFDYNASKFICSTKMIMIMMRMLRGRMTQCKKYDRRRADSQKVFGVELLPAHGAHSAPAAHRTLGAQGANPAQILQLT